MSNYSKKTWVNGVDATNQTNMNNIENGIAAVPGTYFLTTPPQILTNATINSGNTSTVTCTGIGTPTIPSGATAVWVSAYFDGSAIGAFLSFAPHGASMTGQPIIGTTQATGGGHPMAAQILVALSSGQIDIKANSGNASNINAWITAYVI